MRTAVEARCRICPECGGGGHDVETSHFFTHPGDLGPCDLCVHDRCRECGGYGRVSFED